MKTLEIDPAIQADPALLSAIQRTGALLEFQLGRSADQVSASLTLRHDDRGRPLLSLSIADWSGHAETAFRTEELDDARLVEGRMIRLTGDLLGVRSHKLLDQMQAASGLEGP